jgi:hypothetical protein
MIVHIMRPPSAPPIIVAPTTQEAAIVMGGGGDPLAEYELAKELCARAGRTVTIFAGNDMIEKFPDDITHAVSLHPDKLQLWLPRRQAAGFNQPEKVWAHRNYEGAVTHWTRDWSGSTGLFCVKIAREAGFVHIILCGVPMTVEGDHFIREQPWSAAIGFLKGWNAHLSELKPYVRSYAGWTQEQLGTPTEDWLRSDIIDPGSAPSVGQKA